MPRQVQARQLSLLVQLLPRANDLILPERERRKSESERGGKSACDVRLEERTMRRKGGKGAHCVF